MSTETVLRSSGVYTTILGALNQFQAFTELQYVPLQNTTLNNKYATAYPNGGVVNLASPPTTPALGYFGIGTRGFMNVGGYSSVAFPGDARMMDLYAPIPIRCIRVSDEENMSTSERAPYRLRVVRELNGIPYALYYLKKIEFSPTIEVVGKDTDGKEETFTFDPATWLVDPPIPSIDETGGVIDTALNRVIVRAKGTCTVTHEEIMEAVNYLYNGDTNYARISEIGYYTGCEVGVDEDWSYTENSNNAKYIEAAYVQLAKGHCFRGSELTTPGSVIKPVVTFESESCINGTIA